MCDWISDIHRVFVDNCIALVSDDRRDDESLYDALARIRNERDDALHQIKFDTQIMKEDEDTIVKLRTDNARLKAERDSALKAAEISDEDCRATYAEHDALIERIALLEHARNLQDQWHERLPGYNHADRQD